MDNFVKQLIISLFHTILVAFLNMCEMSKTSYNLGRKEYINKKSNIYSLNLNQIHLTFSIYKIERNKSHE